MIVDCSQQLCNLCHYCELPFNPCPLIPGGSCCIIGAINAVTGFGVWSCSELACVLLTSVGGFGCAVIGGAVCCLAYDPNCSDEPCCEIIHRNPSEYCPGCYNNNDGYPMAYYIFKSLFNAYAELQLESKLDGLN